MKHTGGKDLARRAGGRREESQITGSYILTKPFATLGTHDRPMKLPSGPQNEGVRRRSVRDAFQSFLLCSSPWVDLVKLWVAGDLTASLLISLSVESGPC